jgi:hypothetical protein
MKSPQPTTERHLITIAVVLGLAGLYIFYRLRLARGHAREAEQRAEERWEAEGGSTTVAS